MEDQSIVCFNTITGVLNMRYFKAQELLLPIDVKRGRLTKVFVKRFKVGWTMNCSTPSVITSNKHYEKPVFFVMSPKIVGVLLDINIFEKEMWKNIRMNGML